MLSSLFRSSKTSVLIGAGALIVLIALIDWHAINELHKLLPPDLANTEQAKRLQLVYRPTEPQGASKVCEFSRSSMEVRWQQGISNARTALHASPWRAPTPRELGVRVFDVM